MTHEEFIDIPCGELDLVIAELTKSELKIWLFLTKNREKSVSTSCSTVAFLSGKLNVSESTAKKAISRLKDLKLDYLLNNWN